MKKIEKLYNEEGEAGLKQDLMPLRIAMIGAAFDAVIRAREEAKIRTQSDLTVLQRRLAKAEKQSDAEAIIINMATKRIELDDAIALSDMATKLKDEAFADAGGDAVEPAADSNADKPKVEK